MNGELKLLVEWSSPWQEFVTAIRPAMARSPERLAGEARTGLASYRGMFASWILELALLALAIMVSEKIATLRPYEPPAIPKYDVIYFSGDELPRTEDASGAQAGHSGRAGGHEARHRTQTIRVARGEAVRERVVDAPKLKLPQSDSAVANLLAFKPIPGPAPTEGLKPSLRLPSMTGTAIAPAPEVRTDKTQRAPMLNANVVPPTPESQPDKMRPVPSMSAAIVPPSPSAPQRDIFVPVPGSQAVTVVPPPVSAPEQATNLHPKLTLPPPSVVAPPPTQIARDVNPRGPGFGAGELQNQVVPPPASVAGASTTHRAFNGAGTPDVVPPPVQLNGAATGTRAVAGLGNATVVPPPVQLNGAPSGTRRVAGLGTAAVVPPPVQVGGGSLQHPTMTGLGGGAAVVPPPPTVSGEGSLSGLGRGNHGAGQGGPMDAGSLAAPPSNNGGSGGGTGIVVSDQPGPKIGVPGNSGAGSLAMSPSGGDKPGVGGSGGGASIGRGAGPGSGLSGEGSGAAKADVAKTAGHGSDTIARGGISPYPGSGGAGSGTAGKPPMPGVSVNGGSNIVTLPSFGADGAGPNIAGRSSIGKDHEGPGITVVGSARSGGAFNFYGMLKGDKNYTIYIDTVLGTAVMQYADPSSAAHPYAEDLIAPQPMRSDLPANLKPSRLVIACILDRSGTLKNLQVLDGGGSQMTSKVLAALPSWKFRPVFRGDQAIDVNAILGFDIDTR